MQLYFFHIRDDFGFMEDLDGIELPDLPALLAEVMRSVNELSQEATPPPNMRFEVADANGRTVLVAPVHGSMADWDLITELPMAHALMQ